MRSPFDAVPEAVIKDVIADNWDVKPASLRYLPEGGGAYHWIAEIDEIDEIAKAGRAFVTCDDLDTKPWLGSHRDEVFASLVVAYRTAIDLQAAGCAFVVAPVPTVFGGPAARLDDRHSLSVFPYVGGEPGQWGRTVSSRARQQLVARLAELHQADRSGCTLPPRGLEVPGRVDLETALGDLSTAWDAGPLSDEVRHLLATHEDLISRSLVDLDRLAAAFPAGDAGAVITHGEPHPGNLLWTSSGLALLDWDTVAVGRPERDMWMLDDGAGSTARAYFDLTGVMLDPEALAGYRLLWAITDVAAFTIQLRRQHDRDSDAVNALAGLRSILAGREPSPYGRPPPGVPK